jgi:hypothetical protein
LLQQPYSAFVILVDRGEDKYVGFSGLPKVLLQTGGAVCFEPVDRRYLALHPVPGSADRNGDTSHRQG